MTDYYISPSGDDGTGDGSIGTPWRTQSHAESQMSNGDTLYCRGGTYSSDAGYNITTEITIQAYTGETPVFDDHGQIDIRADNVVIDGLTYQNLAFGTDDNLYRVGISTILVNDITIKSCDMGTGNERNLIRIVNVDGLTIGGASASDGNILMTNSNVNGTGRHAIIGGFTFSDNVTIKNNTFPPGWGADCVHMGDNTSAICHNWLIEDNDFDQNDDLPGGENFIDIKNGRLDGTPPIVGCIIRGNTFTGNRPSGVDAAGNAGGSPQGAAIVIHETVIDPPGNVLIERNLFDDNTNHISITSNSFNITVQNNIFINQALYTGKSFPSDIDRPAYTGYALRIRLVDDRIYLYNNTFLNNGHLIEYRAVTMEWKNNIMNHGGINGKYGTNIDSDYSGWENNPTPGGNFSGPNDVHTSDFRLTGYQPDADSPLVGQGVDIVAVTDDYEGTARLSPPTMGAYVAITSTPSPPPPTTSTSPIVVSVDLQIDTGFSSRELPINVFSPLVTGGAFIESINRKITSYTHESRALGGYYSAAIEMRLPTYLVDDWIENGLGRHVVVKNPALDVIWEGFVNLITVTYGLLSFTIGPLLEIGNQVKVTFSTSVNGVIGTRQDTDYADDTISQSIYGILQRVRSIGGTTLETAEQVRDLQLAQSAYPDSPSNLILSGGAQGGVVLDCLGYWHWLENYVYNNSSTGMQTVRNKILAVLGAEPNGTIFSDDYSRVSTVSTSSVDAEENKNRKALTIIKKLVELGDLSNNRMTAGFYKDRQFVYQRSPTTYRYRQQVRQNLRLQDRASNQIDPWDVNPAEFVYFPDFMPGREIPTGSSLNSSLKSGFIEVVQYTAPYDLSIDSQKTGNLDQVLAKVGLGV